MTRRATRAAAPRPCAGCGDPVPNAPGSGSPRRWCDRCKPWVAVIKRGRAPMRRRRLNHPGVAGRRWNVKALQDFKLLHGCIVCGYADEPRALTFHHVDPAVKLFELSRGPRRATDDEVDAELAKCVVLCQNHHAEVHAGRHWLLLARKAS